jgi:hypothetical protein
LDSTSLTNERQRAAADDLGAQFANGSNLAAQVPATALGRMLNPEETSKLIERFDRGLPKRPAASVRRRAAPGRKQA